MPIPNVPIGGIWQGSLPGAQGTLHVFGVDDASVPPDSVTTGQSGSVFISGADASAYWELNAYMPFYCGNLYYQGQETVDDVNYFNYETGNLLIDNLATQSINCAINGVLRPASTRFAILGSLPSSLTLGSMTPFSTQFGMPQLYIYDGTRSLVATETATSVASDNSTATFSFPTSLVQGGYSLAVLNATNSSPSYIAADVNLLSIATSTTISGNPFGVSVASQTKLHSTKSLCGSYHGGTSTSSSLNFPVVSLYSANELLVNGSYVVVGANPTAVVAYSSNPTTQDNSTDCEMDVTTVSGLTRAVVANSGGNTVSVVDTVGRSVLYNITVGNQPVAIAVSSDGTTAYVANYADSTVSDVSLQSGALVSTVAVSGQPTSVSLTSSGTLWVAGNGFINQIDTSSMSVQASQSLGGKSIIALGYSDSVGQIVATSTDNLGQIYTEDISPASVSSGGTYAPMASTSISSLAKFQNPTTGAYSYGYTATAVQGSFQGGGISSTLVGAPPLVVQDGWAVVSATPTGFTVTDITGHVVMISEVTPSPVAAIAVNTNLNVAYLTLPDSNILLEVPLPGVN